MKIISVIFIMNRLNNLINNCYVITLHNKKERYDNVIYNKQFIPKLHIFYAYEGNHMNINDLYKHHYISQSGIKNLSKNQIGCLMSHIKLWEKLVNESKSDEFIILEDDFVTDNNFNLNLQNALYELPTNYDILYLFHHDHYNSIISKSSGKYIKKCPAMWGLIGYLVNIKTLKKLLKLIKPLNTAIDDSIINLSKRYRLNTYCCFPRIIQNNGQGGTCTNKIKSSIF